MAGQIMFPQFQLPRGGVLRPSVHNCDSSAQTPTSKSGSIPAWPAVATIVAPWPRSGEPGVRRSIARSIRAASLGP